jgi:hypothetical protein
MIEPLVALAAKTIAVEIKPAVDVALLLFVSVIALAEYPVVSMPPESPN